MSAATVNFKIRQVSVFLGGNPATLKDWAAQWERSRVLGYVAVIISGAGLYGAAMGYFISHWVASLKAGK